MDYRDGKKCLDEILAAVKPEDEEQYFCNVEYLEHYNGVVLGEIHDDWFGNIFEVFETKNKWVINGKIDDFYTWNSFEEAKKRFEEKDNPASKCFRLKEGLRIAFEHEMILSELYDGDDPKWVVLYNKWLDLKNEYLRKFMSDEDLQKRSEALLELADAFSKAIEGENNHENN